jgi:arsenite oxidase small subunit
MADYEEHASPEQSAEPCALRHGMTRRKFLFRAGSATATVMLTGIPGVSRAMEVPVWVASYPSLRIARLSDLSRHTPISFEYPDENSGCFLVQMEGAAGGGVGPEADIVAFHATCPHMGGPLWGTYRPEHAAAGPCPLHLTSFDLRRHGMVIAGHATESLPQVVLDIQDGWVYATAMMGLIFGRTANVQG